MNHDDHWLERLLEVRARSGSADAAGPCPDPLLIAGLVEGRLVEEERERVVRHLADCDACMDEVEDLLAERAEERADSAPAPRLRAPAPVRWFALAASVLIVVGAGLWLALRPSGSEGGDVEGALVAALEDLGRRSPELFATIAPLARAERLAAPDAATRGGTFAVRSPVGHIDSLRPVLAWTPAPGASMPYAVEIRAAADGTVVLALEARTQRVAWPPDAPDLARGETYVMKVAVRTPLGEESGRARFAVATEAELRAFEERSAEVERTLDAPLRDLVVAHVALRAGFLEAAEAAARRYAGARPDEPVGRETLYAVLRRLGSPEAARYAPR